MSPSSGWPAWSSVTNYHFHTARQGDANEIGILAYCPEHHLLLRCNGTVEPAWRSEQDEEKDALKADDETKKVSTTSNLNAALSASEPKHYPGSRKESSDDADVQLHVDFIKAGLSRTWTYKSGQEVKGKFLRFQGAYVIVRHDDGYDDDLNPKFHDFGLEIQKLSDTDQKIIASLARQ